MADRLLFKARTVKMWGVTTISLRSVDACNRDFIFGGL